MTRLWRYRTALLNLVLLRLRVRYNRLAFGFVWSLASPLFYMAIFWFVFAYLLRSDVPDYPIFVLAGILPWNFFSAGLLGAISSLPGERDLLTKLAFPRELLPIAAVCAEAILFAAALVTISTALIATRHATGHGVGLPVLGLPLLGLPVLALPLLVALLVAFTLGAGLLLAALNVWVRDVLEVMPVLLFGWFFLTPVVYPLEQITPQLAGLPTATLMQIVNPMAALVNAFREVVYHQRWPQWECVLVAGGISVVLLACGLLVMRRLGPYMAEEL